MSGRERAYDSFTLLQDCQTHTIPFIPLKNPKTLTLFQHPKQHTLQMKLLAPSNMPSHFSRPMRSNASLLWPLLLTSHRCQPPHTTSKSRVEPTHAHPSKGMPIPVPRFACGGRSTAKTTRPVDQVFEGTAPGRPFRTVWRNSTPPLPSVLEANANDISLCVTAG